MEIPGPPDAHYISAALGWTELGNVAEAKAELNRVSQDLANHPAVLEVKWNIQAAEKDWGGALKTADLLVATAADSAAGWLHRAYAARRAPGGGVQAAWDALLPAVDRFPTEATIPYNLACYACQMQKLDEARRWIRRAVIVGEKHVIKSMACSDPDLKPLWSEIKQL